VKTLKAKKNQLRTSVVTDLPEVPVDEREEPLARHARLEQFPDKVMVPHNSIVDVGMKAVQLLRSKTVVKKVD
jgi:hypothetical protein